MPESSRSSANGRGQRVLITLNRPAGAERPHPEHGARDAPGARRVGERPGGDPRGRHRRRRAGPSAPAATSASSTTLGRAGRLDEALAFWREEYELNIVIKRLSEALRLADRRHRHGRRRRRLAARQPPGRRGALPFRHAGGRHRLLPGRGGDLRAAAPARARPAPTRSDGRARSAPPMRWRSGLRPMPSAPT